MVAQVASEGEKWCLPLHRRDHCLTRKNTSPCKIDN